MTDFTRQRILVLCTGNSCRSQMAEGWLNTRYEDRLQAVSAGSSPAGYVHPLAVAVMREVGIDISDGRSKHMTEFLTQPFDVVITVCDPAREACPVFPGTARRVHQNFDDPAEVTGSADAVLAEFRRVRDEIREFLDALFADEQ